MSEMPHSLKHSVSSKAVRAAAAAWVAQMHGDDDGKAVEVQFRAWLSESEEHRRAYDRMNQIWRLAGKATIRSGDVIASSPGQWSRFARGTAVAAALLILMAVTLRLWREDVMVTAVGQRQVRVLKDGTRVSMNTDTRIEVNYDKDARRMRLVHGEARFDVAKRPDWPFLVTVEKEEIRALGTSFVVRRDDLHNLSVTLIEGRIAITPTDWNESAVSRSPQLLTPGQRLVISAHTQPKVDRPELARITAWEHGRVEFDDTPLQDAVDEMNRYSAEHVSVANAQVGRLRIGGVFHAGNSDEFVSIASSVLALRADRQGHEITLSQPDAKSR